MTKFLDWFLKKIDEPTKIKIKMAEGMSCMLKCPSCGNWFGISWVKEKFVCPTCGLSKAIIETYKLKRNDPIPAPQISTGTLYLDNITIERIP